MCTIHSRSFCRDLLVGPKVGLVAVAHGTGINYPKSIAQLVSRCLHGIGIALWGDGRWIVVVDVVAVTVVSVDCGPHLRKLQTNRATSAKCKARRLPDSPTNESNLNHLPKYGCGLKQSSLASGL